MCKISHFLYVICGNYTQKQQIPHYDILLFVRKMTNYILQKSANMIIYYFTKNPNMNNTNNSECHNRHA